MATVRSRRQGLPRAPSRRTSRSASSSFASTAGVDVKPTTDRAAVQQRRRRPALPWRDRALRGRPGRRQGAGHQGERSIVLLSDGGDTVESPRAATAREAAQLKAAVDRPDQGQGARRGRRLQERGVQRRRAQAASPPPVAASVATAGDRAAVAAAFDAAARTPGVPGHVRPSRRPPGLTGVQRSSVKGSAVRLAVHGHRPLDLGAAAPVVESDRRRAGHRRGQSPAVPRPPTSASISGVSCSLAVVGPVRSGSSSSSSPPSRRPSAPAQGARSRRSRTTAWAPAPPRRRAAKATPSAHRRAARRHGRAVHVRPRVDQPDDGAARPRRPAVACRRVVRPAGPRCHRRRPGRLRPAARAQPVGRARHRRRRWVSSCPAVAPAVPRQAARQASSSASSPTS